MKNKEEEIKNILQTFPEKFNSNYSVGLIGI